MPTMQTTVTITQRIAGVWKDKVFLVKQDECLTEAIKLSKGRKGVRRVMIQLHKDGVSLPCYTWHFWLLPS